MKKLLYTFVLLLIVSINASERLHYSIGLLLEEGNFFAFDKPKSGPALEMAKERINTTLYSRLNVTFVDYYIKTKPYMCINDDFGAAAAELFYVNKIHAYFGPGCSAAVEIVSLQATSWNMPIVSPVATNGILANKKSHKTLTRMTSDDTSLAIFIIRVLRYFKWSTIVIIKDLSHFLFGLRVESFAPEFEAANITFKIISFDAHGTHNKADILKEASRSARVFLTLVDGSTLRQTIATAYHLGMTNGDYVFLTKRDLATYAGRGDALKWAEEDYLDSILRTAFDCVLIIEFRYPIGEEYTVFENRMKLESATKYNYSYGNAAVSRYIINFYEALVSFASGLSNAFEDGADIYNGRQLVKKYFWNRTFRGIDRNVAIDANGDRDEDISLYDTDADGKYRVIMDYLGEHGKLLPIPGVTTHWPNNKGPPPNEPPCGYLGDAPECQTTTLPTTVLITILFFLLIAILVIFGLCKFRKMKREADLQSKWWRIEVDDISAHASIRSKQSFAHASFTCGDGPMRVGRYKGVKVQVTTLQVKHGGFERKTLLELQQMRDINCCNLTKLFGLCLNEASIGIVTEYCSRGSLEDLLHNHSIQLDKNFKVSIINDLIQGLTSIHLGPIFVHGRLSSSNCVIDSRFLVKLTNFGLQSLRRLDSTEPKESRRHLLYLAPETLRVDQTSNLTQEADIYSLAIILFEILTRSFPYDIESEIMTVDEILANIKECGSRFLRPTFLDKTVDVKVLKIVEACWDDNPSNRPFIRHVKLRLKEATWLTTGGNVFDILIHRMEQYANNLEGLVDEKTFALMEEKKKAEELLYHILPKSVAEQLQNGQQVAPEAYDSVTVYFSDIVDFTTLSSSSTPIQIVDFLNQLYTCFDHIIENFDVYKVETIGDAYMVVSGLPVKNGMEHARQIARLSLSILENISHFKIAHKPGTVLQTRIGLHSGSVCTGVVGLKMPRYCLFGDTVNTASRMESNGKAVTDESGQTKQMLQFYRALVRSGLEYGCHVYNSASPAATSKWNTIHAQAMKIHISSTTKHFLDYFQNFEVESRGEIDIKGKGLMTTYWLMGER